MLPIPSITVQTALALAGASMSVLLAIRTTPGAEQKISWFSRVLLILTGTAWPLLLSTLTEELSLIVWSGYTVLGYLWLYGSTVDIASYRIPNSITFGSFGLLLLIRIIDGTLRNSLYSEVVFTTEGALVAAGSLWFIQKTYFLLRKKRGVGGGDIKLLLSLGGLVGVKGILVMLFVSSVLGLFVAVCRVITQQSEITRQTAIPFGPYLCVGAAITHLWGNVIFDYLFC